MSVQPRAGGAFAIHSACAALLMSMFPSHTAQAETCRDIDALQEAAEGTAVPPGGGCIRYAPAEGGMGIACFWTFAYREAAALDYARDLWRQLTSCRPGGKALTEAAVNHPDSYALRQWQTDAALYSVSVKDKAAMGRTLVILRREARGPASGQ